MEQHHPFETQLGSEDVNRKSGVDFDDEEWDARDIGLVLWCPNISMAAVGAIVTIWSKAFFSELWGGLCVCGRGDWFIYIYI